MIRPRDMARFAARYVWWRPPHEAVRFPRLVAAQVMEMGDYADVCELVKRAGTRYLRTVLRTAEAGLFSPRSWHYWHYRLGMARPGEVPPLPRRRVE